MEANHAAFKLRFLHRVRAPWLLSRLVAHASFKGMSSWFLENWLLVPSGNRGPAGSDEGEVVRSAGSRPALPARLPEQPERSGAARRGGLRTSAAAERPPARSPARSPARARLRHRPAPVPAPPRPVQSGPSRGLRAAAGQIPTWVSLRAE